jgi:hypothetical protein
MAENPDDFRGDVRVGGGELGRTVFQTITTDIVATPTANFDKIYSNYVLTNVTGLLNFDLLEVDTTSLPTILVNKARKGYHCVVHNSITSTADIQIRTFDGTNIYLLNPGFSVLLFAEDTNSWIECIIASGKEVCIEGNPSGELYCIEVDEIAGYVYLKDPDGNFIRLADLDSPTAINPNLQQWTVVNKTSDGRDYNANHQVDSSNIADLQQVAEYDMFPNSNVEDVARGDVWVGFTMDSNNVFIAFHNLQNDSGTPINPNGRILCVSRNDGSIRWTREMKHYSGLDGDITRAAILVDEEESRIYFASSLFNAQAWESIPGGTDTTVYNLFTGAPEVGIYNEFSNEIRSGTGVPARLYCALISITQSPKLLQIDGKKYIGCGTSSAQSFLTSVRTRSQATIFGGATPLFTNQGRMTEVGRYSIIDADSGILMKSISAGPPIYKEGKVMNNADSVEDGGGYLRPAETQMRINHFVEAEDVLPGGPLGTGGVLDSATGGSNGEDQWIGSQRISWFLEERNGNNVVPSALGGLAVKDRQNAPITLTGVNEIVSKTSANPCVLTTSINHNFTVADVNVLVDVKGDSDIPDGKYDILAVGANTISINYDNTLGGTSGGAVVYGSKIDISSVSVANPAVVTCVSPHGLAVGDVVDLCRNTDIPSSKYTVSLVGSPTSFEIAFDNSAGSGASDGYIALVNRALSSPAGRDSVVTQLIDAHALGIDTSLSSGSLSFVAPSGSFDLNSLGCNLDGSFGDGFTSPARLIKYIQDGDVLSDQDAYEASYHGASLWGSSPSSFKDENNNDLELYAVCGQSHHVPLDDILAVEGTSTAPRYIQQENMVKSKQDAFEGGRSAGTLANVKSQQLLNRPLWNKADKDVPLSPRSERFFGNGVFAINLRPGNVGDILWSFKQGLDVWHLGFNLFSLRSLAAPTDPTTPVDVPSTNVFPVFQWIDSQEYYGHSLGPDGDYGEGSQLINIGGTNYVSVASKRGTYSTLELTDPSIGPSTMTPLPGTNSTEFVQGGCPGVLGGSNFGSCADDDSQYSVQLQAPSYDTFNLSYQNAERGDYSTTGLPQPFPPQTLWYPTNDNDPVTIQGFGQQQSYLSKYDVVNQTVGFETVIVPGGPNYVACLSCPSVSQDFIYLQDGIGKMRVFNKNTGVQEREFDMEFGGITRPVLVDDEVWSISGRVSSGAGFNTGDSSQAGSDYKGASKLFKFKVV